MLSHSPLAPETLAAVRRQKRRRKKKPPHLEVQEFRIMIKTFHELSLNELRTKICSQKSLSNQRGTRFDVFLFSQNISLLLLLLLHSLDVCDLVVCWSPPPTTCLKQRAMFKRPVSTNDWLGLGIEWSFRPQAQALSHAPDVVKDVPLHLEGINERDSSASGEERERLQAAIHLQSSLSLSILSSSSPSPGWQCKFASCLLLWLAVTVVDNYATLGYWRLLSKV